MFYVNLNKAHVFVPNEEEDSFKEEVTVARTFLQEQGRNEGIFDLISLDFPLPPGSIIMLMPERPAAIVGFTSKNGELIHVLAYAVSPKGL